MSWAEERRADRAAEAEQKRLDAAARAQREQDAIDRAEERERQKQEAKDEQKRKKEAARRTRKGQKRAARRARWGRIARWLNANPVTLFVGYVMVASVVPAIFSQVSALSHAGVWVLLAVLLASMLEGGAWALTFMGKQAEDAGRPTARYRIAAWGAAAVAAGIQVWHWIAIAPLWVAVTFGLSSLFALYLWDLKTHGSHGLTKEQRQERKERARQEGERRRRFPEVWSRYEDILAARPHGAVDPEKVWAEAWFDAHGAELSQTEETISRRLDAVTAVEQVLAEAERTPESVAVDRFLSELFSPQGKGDPGEGGTPLRAPSGGPPKGSPEGATPLGGKGKRASRAASESGSAKAPTKADLEKVRRLADALGDARKLSLRNVREVIGGGRNEYAVRVRDAVKKERGVK
ncbi:hypothetical protein RM844_30235 [Streptomyces sp. DSM 44915]|uniref:DUF2637 domain-containing protein n=1 Tax=Streptomyces chisholmiae TaxID=3075540 RepID=A0ABU2K044_9ACTN|nr:hypothetical protein [Streptomyces sp. DSM 44915]MDT0270560.1 hypothetical protein [Streptomyces sp. DSM 44915]